MKKSAALLLLPMFFLVQSLSAQTELRPLEPAQEFTLPAPASPYPFRLYTPGDSLTPTTGLFIPGFNTEDELLRRAKRQRRTGRILLGTGLGLIATAIAVAANNDDDAIVAGVSLVVIGAPGVLTSLISIPFFVASSRNRRKAAELRVSPGVGWQRTLDVFLQNGKTGYPVAGIKLGF